MRTAGRKQCQKTIVFCADGTWNGPGQTDSDDTTATTTNVFRLFVNLDGHDTPDTALLANEQERVLTDDNGVVAPMREIPARRRGLRTISW